MRHAGRGKTAEERSGPPAPAIKKSAVKRVSSGKASTAPAWGAGSGKKRCLAGRHGLVNSAGPAIQGAVCMRMRNGSAHQRAFPQPLLGGVKEGILEIDAACAQSCRLQGKRRREKGRAGKSR